MISRELFCDADQVEYIEYALKIIERISIYGFSLSFGMGTKNTWVANNTFQLWSRVCLHPLPWVSRTRHSPSSNYRKYLKRKDLKYDPTNPHYLTKAENCLHEDITGNVKLIESIFKAPDPLKQSLLKSGNIKQSRIVKVSPKATWDDK